jgi:DeoR/GlpR family transcriptional regulator of sugar metabolism
MSQRIVRSARQERLHGILQTLLEDKSASPQSLAAFFDVSVMTMHRDLDELQRRGLLRKVHGGVVVERTRSHEIAASLRSLLAVPQKLAIAKAAAQQVRPGEVVMLDDSTTAARVIPHLLGIEDLRVATNYLPALADLTASGEVAVQALGGDFDHAHESFLGLGTIQAVRALRADLLFFSGTSADLAGVYHQEEKIVALKEHMVASSRRCVLVMDSSKFGQDSLHLMTEWHDIDQLITDDGISNEILDGLRSQGVDVQVVVAASEPRVG